MPFRASFRTSILLPAALALLCAAAPLGAQQRDTTRPPLTRGVPTTQQQPAQDTGRTGQTETGGRGGGIRLRPATVPDVRGMTLTEARARLVRAGLLPGRIDSVAAEARQGTVVAQGPQPGTPVIPGYSVRLTLAKADVVTVPDLSGATPSAARSALADERLSLGGVDSTESERGDGTIVGQKPAAGTTVTPGTSVTVTVASARLVAVPALAGQPLARAEAALRSAGLRVGGVRRENATGAPDRVLAQSRAAGERVRPGTSVDLTVAIGTVAVPDLAGRTLAEAREALGAAGLRAGGVDSAESRRAEGTVVAQSPAAGAQVAPGSPVAVSVARAALVVVPRVVGASPADAARALESARLVPGGTGADASTVVLAQSPAAGTRVRPGTRVDLRYSAAVVPADSVVEEQVATGDSVPADTAGQVAAGDSVPADTAGEIVVASTRVPDVVGMTLDEARRALAPLGLRHEVDAALADSAAWLVTQQEPAAGSQADAGARVRLALAPPAGSPGRGADAGEPARIPWLWIVAGLLLLAAGAAAMMARRRPGRGGGGERQARPAAPPPTVVLSDTRWDPGSSEVRVSGKLLKTPEVMMRAAGDRGVQRVDVQGSLIAAEVGE